MPDLIKDYWEFIVFLMVSIMGIGEARFRVVQNAAEIKILKETDFCTEAHCKETREACRAIMCLKHTQYKEETIKLTRLIEHVNSKSDEHYENMINRIDHSNERLIKVILSQNNGGK